MSSSASAQSLARYSFGDRRLIEILRVMCQLLWSTMRFSSVHIRKKGGSIYGGSKVSASYRCDFRGRCFKDVT
jgi:hypothetical protein